MEGTQPPGRDAHEQLRLADLHEQDSLLGTQREAADDPQAAAATGGEARQPAQQPDHDEDAHDHQQEGAGDLRERANLAPMAKRDAGPALDRPGWLGSPSRSRKQAGGDGRGELQQTGVDR